MDYKKIIEKLLFDDFVKTEDGDKMVEEVAVHFINAVLNSPECEDKFSLLRLLPRVLEHVAARIDEYVLYMEDELKKK